MTLRPGLPTLFPTLVLVGLLGLLGARAVSAGPCAAPPAARLRATPILGGGGGTPFEARGPGGAPLVGLRHTTIVWAGHRIIRSLQPLFLVDGEIRGGEVLGRPNGEPRETLAKPGYAVGGLLVRAGHRVDGFALVFLRTAGDRLDRSDVHTGPWIGGRGGGEERILGASGRVVAGICGRHGADLDALGLLVRAPITRPSEDRLVRLTFSGRIDGSERIVIGAEEARWENVYWGTSKTTVRLGGVSWTPRENPVLLNRGATAYLSVPVDFSTARLVKTNGRDVVTLSAGPTSVTVRIADNPNGTDLYEFSVLLERSHRFAELSIRATIDGSDEILVTAEKATWRHRHWGWPRGEVLLNDTPWDPQRKREIPNEGSTRYLPEGVDFASARVVHTRGRDVAAVEIAADRLIVRFVDTPVGARVYEVVIRFGEPPQALSGGAPACR